MSNRGSPKNVILTGVPRGGTTLTCSLINELSDAVALHEPMDALSISQKSAPVRISSIQKFFEDQRQLILNRSVANSKSFRGKVPANHLDDTIGADGHRVMLLDGQEIEIEKTLFDDFTLCIKHPNLFTAMLDDIISAGFSCFAIVRNPLSALMSWRDSNLPISTGHVPVAENIYSSLAKRLRSTDDVLQRQLILMDWFFIRYKILSRKSIIRYEDVIVTGGRTLTRICESASTLQKELHTRNMKNSNSGSFRELAGELVSFGGAYLDFYSEAEIFSLVESAN